MLSLLFAHVGRPLAPHDLLGSWDLATGAVVAVIAAVYAGASRVSPRTRGRDASFFRGLAILAVALVSPLEGLAGSLASAHMVQHMLILLVAAPLLARARMLPVLLRVMPLGATRSTWRWLRRLGLHRGRLDRIRHPLLLWLFYVGVLWFWHASGPYQAAVDHDWIHVLEHATFIVAGVGFWSLVWGVGRHALVVGLRVLMVFAAAMQGVLLAALLTFSPAPWYPVYSVTTAPFGLDPLTDQQLAGLVLWVPASLLYVGVALFLIARWVADDGPVPDGSQSFGVDRLDGTRRRR